MFYNNVRKNISNLLIIAIFAMIISPLCHLKGAQNFFIEICTAAGIQRISIEPAQAAENFDKNNQDRTTVIQSKCPICLLSGKKLVLPQLSHFVGIFTKENNSLIFIAENLIYTDNHSDIFSARAPPPHLQT